MNLQSLILIRLIETGREAFRKGMRSFDERIALAQSEGNAALANEIYTKQMNWIASVKGDTPIVGGRTATGLRNV